MKYIICGFSGAGKSYLLKQLQSVTSLNSYNFIDLDQYILENYAQNFSSLGNFITQKGWEYFRNIEKIAINQLLEQEDLIIALGGGTLTQELLLKFQSDTMLKSFWLNTSFETCWERIKEDTNRPLVKNGILECRKIYNERVELYKNCAKIYSAQDFLNSI